MNHASPALVTRDCCGSGDERLGAGPRARHAPRTCGVPTTRGDYGLSTKPLPTFMLLQAQRTPPTCLALHLRAFAARPAPSRATPAHAPRHRPAHVILLRLQQARTSIHGLPKRGVFTSCCEVTLGGQEFEVCKENKKKDDELVCFSSISLFLFYFGRPMLKCAAKLARCGERGGAGKGGRTSNKARTQN